MIKIPENKIYNAYMVETKDIDGAINTIKIFIERFGFEKVLIDSGTHPDFTIIKLENKDIRDQVDDLLMSKISIKPSIAERRVFIIYSDKTIPNHIQNMLLKTLEEPPIYVSIFIITNTREYFLDTIKSRVFLIRDFTDNLDNFGDLDNKLKDNLSILISDIKYKDAFDIIDFSKVNYTKVKSILNYMLYLMRDSLYYKKTYDKNRLNLQDRLTYIETIADNYTYEAIGILIREIEESMGILDTNVDKELMIENIFYKLKDYIDKE